MKKDKWAKKIMKIKLKTLFFSKASRLILLLLILSTSAYAEKSTLIDTCLSKRPTLDETKAVLLKQAIGQATRQLYGETVRKEVKSQQQLTTKNSKESFNEYVDIVKSSNTQGKVYVKGNPYYYKYQNNQYCIKVTCFATNEDLERFSHALKRISSNILQCADSREKAWQKSRIALLKEHYPSLESHSNKQLSGLVYKPDYKVSSDNISAGGRYCVTITAKIRPYEIESLLNKAQQQKQPPTTHKRVSEVQFTPDGGTILPFD